jgi:integrase
VPGLPPFLGPAKTRESVRLVPVPTFAIEALAAHLEAFPAPADGLVFTNDRGAPMFRTTMHGQWKQTLRRAGFDEGMHFHHLRHHYASVLIDGGESVKVVQERLGQASAEETLRTYSHLMRASEQRTRSVVESAWASCLADSVRTSDAL